MAEGDHVVYGRVLMEYLREREYEDQIRELFLSQPAENNQNESSNRPRKSHIGVQTDLENKATCVPWLLEIERKTEEFCTELNNLLNRFYNSYREETRRYLIDQRNLERHEDIKIQYLTRLSRTQSGNTQSADSASTARPSRVMSDSYALGAITDFENRLKLILERASAIRRFMMDSDFAPVIKGGTEASDAHQSKMNPLNLNSQTSVSPGSEIQSSLSHRSKTLPVVAALKPESTRNRFKSQKPEKVRSSRAKNFSAETNNPPANVAYMHKQSQQELASGSTDPNSQGAIPKRRKNTLSLSKSCAGNSSRKPNADNSTTQKPVWR